LRLRYRITAGSGRTDAFGFPAADILVELKGTDTPLLLDEDGALLLALEHIAAKVLRLEPSEHDRISFDADDFKQERDEDLRDVADEAIDQVRATGASFAFEPMSSRERRMLHLFLKESGLQTSSSGEGPRRHVVLYPAGARIPEEVQPVRRAFAGRDGSGSRGNGRGYQGRA
jgi:spoIIIJ-associated protein